MSEFTHGRLVSILFFENIGEEAMLIALAVLVTIGAFILGITVSWLAKGYVEDFIENAAYAKSVTHPEMFDQDGNMLHDELIYIRPETNLWELDDDDDD
tara:strand:- start:6138 stop:6434 length:297 start_codon:yes stop_codon:yes gene_type:complete